MTLPAPGRVLVLPRGTSGWHTQNQSGLIHAGRSPSNAARGAAFHEAVTLAWWWFLARLIWRACRIEIYEYTVLKTMLRALLSRPLLLGLVLAPLAIALVLLVHWLLAVT